VGSKIRERALPYQPILTQLAFGERTGWLSLVPGGMGFENPTPGAFERNLNKS